MMKTTTYYSRASFCVSTACTYIYIYIYTHTHTNTPTPRTYIAAQNFKYVTENACYTKSACLTQIHDANILLLAFKHIPTNYSYTRVLAAATARAIRGRALRPGGRLGQHS
jgi:hypothetical protein